jgi:hypothetical protein
VLIITFSWGFQLGGHIYKIPTSTPHHQTGFLAPLLERKKISARGVSRFQSFTLLLFFFYFIFACIFLSKLQKN